VRRHHLIGELYRHLGARLVIVEENANRVPVDAAMRIEHGHRSFHRLLLGLSEKRTAARQREDGVEIIGFVGRVRSA
jgi:hypothetical protein